MKRRQAIILESYCIKVNTRDRYSRTALLYAALNSRLAVIKLLVNAEAYIDLREKLEGR